MRHVWIETLTLPFLTWCAITGKWFDVVFFIRNMTPAAGYALRLWRSMGLKHPSVEEFDVRMSVHDEHGRALIYRQHTQVARLASGLSSCLTTPDWLPPEYRPFSDEWGRLLKAHYSEKSMRPVLFLCVMENAYRTGRVSSAGVKRVVTYYGGKILGHYTAKNYDAKIESPCSIRLWPLSLYSASYVNLPAWVFWMLVTALRSTRAPRAQAEISAIGREKGTIFVQFGHWIFKRAPAAGHLCWYDGSGIDPRRIVMYFNRQGDSPRTPEVQAKIAAQGFGWADMDLLHWHLEPRQRFPVALKAVWKARSALPRRWNDLEIWRWATLAYFSFFIESQREILRKFNVVAITQHWEFQTKLLVLAIAARMEDTLFTWNFWSVPQFLRHTFECAFADVLLISGDFDQGYCRAMDFEYKFAIQIGFVIGDGQDGSEREMGVEIRGRLAPDVQFVIAVADTSFDSVTTHNNADHLISFYSAILQAIRVNPRWACVIKPKNPLFAENFLHCDSVQGIIAELESEGRCIRLDHLERISVAAHAADVAVCLTTGTAGVIAALCGKPALHLDIAGLSAHPLSLAGGNGTIVFHNEEALIEALKAVEEGSCEIGDHTPWLDAIDPFQDWKGRIRMGWFLKAFLEARERGLDRDTALQATVEAYSNRWGSARVARRHDHHDTEYDQLWRRARKEAQFEWPSPVTSSRSGHVYSRLRLDSKDKETLESKDGSETA